MAARTTKGDADRSAALDSIAADGAGAPREWSSGPGDRFGWHEHPDPKILFCVAGAIVFHTDGGDVDVDAGDRLDLEARTRHAATVGPTGCTCIEAWGS
jgi:mannose-6-phosphate isomerase-like protein (cupin superfamily)